MRNLKIIVICLFLVIAVVFSVVFCHDRLTTDRTAPKIFCDSTPLQVSVHATDRELCAGLTAIDDVDGDITDRILVRRTSHLSGANTAVVYYVVFDSSSNYCMFNRTITYTDYRMPRFSLSQPLSFPTNSTILLKDRLTAYDVIDGDISQRIRVSAAGISTYDQGEYPFTVQVTNSSGDTSIITLFAQIENTTSRHPTIELSEYIHYVSVGEALSEDSLRALIVSAHESADGEAVDPEDIQIIYNIDTDKRGSYRVEYVYTNAAGLTRTVLMTLVVE